MRSDTSGAVIVTFTARFQGVFIFDVLKYWHDDYSETFKKRA